MEGGTASLRCPRQRAPLALALVGALVAGGMVLPLGHLLVRAAEADAPLALVRSSRVVGLLWGTLRLALVVTSATVVLGVALAWLVERSDLPGRRILGLAAALPLVVPTYVGALALKAAFGPAGLAFEVPGLIGFWGAAWALALSTYPYVYLMARATLVTIDPALEDAARALGDGRAAVFRRVLLPQLRPAVAAGGLLSFLYVLSDFGAVSILQYDTLTRGIFLEYRSLSADRSPAAVLGVVLVLLAVAAVAVERLLRGRPATGRTVAPRPPRRVALRGWRGPAAAVVLVVVGAGVLLPVGVVAYWAAVGSSGGNQASVLTGAAATSVGLSAAAALAAVAISVPLAVLAVRHRSRFSRLVETCSYAGYALPGLVIGLALVFFASRYAPLLYQTLGLVVVAYVVRFLPEALGAVHSSLAGVDPALEEAGRSLGRRRLAVTMGITLPLVRPGLLAGGALVFLTAMKELPATLLLRPAGTDTLAVRVWTAASEGLYAQAAPAALLVVAVSALVLWPMRPGKITTGGVGAVVPAGAPLREAP